MGAAVRFVLDGNVIELADVDPTRTVLQYLREDLGRTGTKEGCAEGDCGACTVVLAEIDRDGQDLQLRAINSCIQFLPTLDGKELITVESLSQASGDLHPVQRALVEHHGSQCGFCTPGFVMSLFALYKTTSNPSRRQIDDALAGNLCRCTGYRPIIDAAVNMYSHSGDDWLRQPAGESTPDKARLFALESIRRDDSLQLQKGERRFFAPTTTQELAKLLAAHPDATLLAGGTDVGLWVTKQHRELETVIFTGRVDSMREIATTERHLEVGAAVSLSDVAGPLLAHYPDLTELLLRFASPPIRNAGTLGGNIANGSPIGDSMPALMALNTSLVLRSVDGTREVSLDDFYHDYMVNDLKAGEFVETVRVPLPESGSMLRSYKVSKRFDQDISAVCAALHVKLEENKVIAIRIVFGGLAGTVKRATNAEAALAEKPWSETTIRTAQEALLNDFTPLDDMRASASYRMKLAQNLLMRFWLDSSGQLDESVYEVGRGG
ncbi:MAG: xanthine dehydrogenase small subunit [Pseudomonadota bacterium]